MAVPVADAGRRRPDAVLAGARPVGGGAVRAAAEFVLRMRAGPGVWDLVRVAE